MNHDAHVLLLLLILAIVVVVGFCLPGQRDVVQATAIAITWKQAMWVLGIAAAIFVVKRLVEKGRKLG